jgi:multidrug efflux pump subunit AcrA (membrane-fusion protein)
MEVEIPVPADDLSWLDRQKSVILTATETGQQWTGLISRIGEAVDRETQTIPVFVTVNGSSGLYDGAFLKAVLPGKTVDNGVEIPRKALYSDRYVYLARNGMLDYVKVDILRLQTNTVIIGGGVNTGDTLIVELLQGVTKGMPVMPVVAEDGERPAR